jgi:hypothetical protein
MQNISLLRLPSLALSSYSNATLGRSLDYYANISDFLPADIQTDLACAEKLVDGLLRGTVRAPRMKF